MIIRRKVNRHFTTVPNEPVNDEGLSFEALGLLTYLLSRPDDWQVCVDQPSVSFLCWKEALDGTASSGLPEPKRRSLIGRWLKRCRSDDDREKFRSILAAARRAGTCDPVAYITKAVNTAFPPPPDPKTFAEADWLPKIHAAITTKQWSQAWGPPPGKRGCLVPPDLITANLLDALTPRGKAEQYAHAREMGQLIKQSINSGE
jgi:hypothetical protein